MLYPITQLHMPDSLDFFSDATATAVYSGSTNGAFLPAQVTVSFVIPSCQKYEGKDAKINHIIGALPQLQPTSQN